MNCEEKDKLIVQQKKCIEEIELSRHRLLEEIDYLKQIQKFDKNEIARQNVYISELEKSLITLVKRKSLEHK
jgi:hypothetical protein